MRNVFVLLTLLIITFGVAFADAGPVDHLVDIFRIQMDDEGHASVNGGYGFFAIGGGLNEWFRGTVWFQNKSGESLDSLTVRVAFYNKKQMADSGSVIYKIGHVNPTQIVSQNFTWETMTDEYLIPWVTIRYMVHGVWGEARTRITDSY